MGEYNMVGLMNVEGKSERIGRGENDNVSMCARRRDYHVFGKKLLHHRFQFEPTKQSVGAQQKRAQLMFVIQK
jgi:hypothetical protein